MRQGKAEQALVLPLLLCMTPARSFLPGQMNRLPRFHRGRSRRLCERHVTVNTKLRVKVRLKNLTYHVGVEREEAFGVEHRLDESCNGRKIHLCPMIVQVPLEPLLEPLDQGLGIAHEPLDGDDCSAARQGKEPRRVPRLDRVPFGLASVCADDDEVVRRHCQDGAPVILRASGMASSA